MDVKLTLKLKDAVIERAKKYASERNLSLSKLIENYFDSLTSVQEDKFEISPFVRSISTGKSVPLDIEEKVKNQDYVEYLVKKYQ